MTDAEKNRKAIIDGIVEIFYIKLKIYAENESKAIQWFIETSFSEEFNQFPIINPIKVSKKAQKEYERLTEHLEYEVKELKDIHYDDKDKKFINGGLEGFAKNLDGKGKIFDWEHATSRSYLKDKVLSIKINDLSESDAKKQIKDIINEYQIVWITSEENDKLNKMYKSDRSIGWENVYKECGIDYQIEKE